MSSLNEHAIFKHNPERPSRSYLKGIVIEPGLALNESAAIFYNALDGKKNLLQAASELASLYEISVEQCLTDCIELARDLVAEKIIVQIREVIQ